MSEQATKKKMKMTRRVAKHVEDPLDRARLKYLVGRGQLFFEKWTTSSKTSIPSIIMTGPLVQSKDQSLNIASFSMDVFLVVCDPSMNVL